MLCKSYFTNTYYCFLTTCISSLSMNTAQIRDHFMVVSSSKHVEGLTASVLAAQTKHYYGNV